MALDDTSEDASEKRTKALTDKQLSAMKEFGPTRKRFFDLFSGNLALALAGAQPVLNRTTVERLMDLKLVHYFEPANVHRVEWFVNGGREKMAHQLLMERMHTNKAAFNQFDDAWLGEYRYARFFTEKNRVDELTYNGCKGILEISRQNGVPTFTHRSSNAKLPVGAWEHTGFVFNTSNQIFFLGTAPRGVMRLAIAQKPTHPDSEPAMGVVTSLRSDHPYTPFAARFIMAKVTKENEDFIASLTSDTGRDEFKRLLVSPFFYLLATE